MLCVVSFDVGPSSRRRNPYPVNFLFFRSYVFKQKYNSMTNIYRRRDKKK